MIIGLNYSNCLIHRTTFSIRVSSFSVQKRLGPQKRLYYQQLEENIIHVPGENPNAAALRGTNCFIIGTTQERLMIDSGDVPPINALFIENLRKLLLEQKFRLKDVVISHAIANHFGGAWSVIQLHRELGLELPRVHKKLDNNNYERDMFRMSRYLRDHVRHIDSSCKFTVDEQGGGQSVIKPIETPGHRSDHCSYSLTNTSLKQKHLFPGDMILGSPSVSMDDLSLYLDDLRRVEAMDFDKLYLVHTHTHEPEHMVVCAKKKIRAYIEYREQREQLLQETINKKRFTRESLFDMIYEQEDLSDPLRMKLALTSFNSHLNKLLKERKVRLLREGLSEILHIVK
ncbi:hypothetical protein FGO68_gene4350 [Halteria grandinella]|uniref:Metallo-beta-lactamase domain-containing protein n=1 Tax=Halteria grandinella TaxID=5974 RepID=A0A8J8T3Z5_HALGN|nr:hypothetical protein FGO68_gene4350 [Halteria grandinella]